MGLKKISRGCLEEYVEAGVRPAHIAKECSISRQAVHERLVKMGNIVPGYAMKKLKKRIAILCRKGFSVEEIGDVLGLTEWGVRFHLRTLKLRPNHPKHRRHASILLFCGKGYSGAEIARELHGVGIKMDVNSIRRYLRRVGKRWVDGRRGVKRQ